MGQSIKKNFLYSSLLTTANYIFPFITYPYVSRVLGVTNIGICNFIDSIINYFILFSMMGIAVVGIREISKNRKDRAVLDKTFNSLFALNTISTVIAFSILAIAICTVSKLQEHNELMWLGVAKLVFNYLMIDWLFRGLEEFRYITICSIAVRLAYVVAVFVFIHDKSDYSTYYLLLMLTVAINAIINLFYSQRFVTYHFSPKFTCLYLKPVLILGLYSLLTSMYTSFNVAFLGFVSSETEVGYYTTSTKIYTILLGLYTAFTSVMLPRMSSLLSEGKTDDFKILLSRSFDILIAFAIPISTYALIMAPEIIYLISGKGYEGAILPMRIVMPLLLIIGYEQILVIQTLMPLKKDITILRNSIVGACVGVFLNFALIPYFASVGASIVWFTSELTILVLSQIAVTRTIGAKFPWYICTKNMICNIPLIVLILIVSQFFENPIVKVFISGTILIVYMYILNVRILKNPEIVRLVEVVRKKIQRN